MTVMRRNLMFLGLLLSQGCTAYELEENYGVEETPRAIILEEAAYLPLHDKEPIEADNERFEDGWDNLSLPFTLHAEEHYFQDETTQKMTIRNVGSTPVRRSSAKVLMRDRYWIRFPLYDTEKLGNPKIRVTWEADNIFDDYDREVGGAKPIELYYACDSGKRQMFAKYAGGACDGLSTGVDEPGLFEHGCTYGYSANRISLDPSCSGGDDSGTVLLAVRRDFADYLVGVAEDSRSVGSGRTIVNSIKIPIQISSD